MRNHEKVDLILSKWLSHKSIKSRCADKESQPVEDDKANMGKGVKAISTSKESGFPLAEDYNSILKQKSTAEDYTVEIVELFAKLCPSLPQVQVISSQRKKAISAIWKFARNDINFFETLFSKAEESDFLCGRSGDWKASFDWIIKQGNTIKILEGNYDNRKKSLSQQLQSKEIQDFINH